MEKIEITMIFFLLSLSLSVAGTTNCYTFILQRSEAITIDCPDKAGALEVSANIGLPDFPVNTNKCITTDDADRFVFQLTLMLAEIGILCVSRTGVDALFLLFEIC